MFFNGSTNLCVQEYVHSSSISSSEQTATESSESPKPSVTIAQTVKDRGGDGNMLAHFQSYLNWSLYHNPLRSFR